MPGDMRGRTPLHWAAYEGRRDVAELLLAHHAEVNARTKAGETPLHVALGNNHKDAAELLRQHGGEDTTVTTPTGDSRHEDYHS